MSVSDRRIRAGRLHVYIEPRDAWIGAYVAAGAVYVCPLPFLVLRWTRRNAAGLSMTSMEAHMAQVRAGGRRG